MLIHWAALQGRDRLFELLLQYSDCPIDDEDDTQATPLILAALGGHLLIVKLLITKGVDINHKNGQGHSALQYACSKGWKEIVLFLCENGADINIRDKRNDTPLHRLATTGRVEIMRLLLEGNTKPEVNCVNSEGSTPLHIVCEDENSSCALLLIANGADVNVLNKEKKSPLDMCKPALRRQIKEKLNIKDE